MRGIAASWVLTGDVAAAPIADGAVVLDADGTVVAVGPRGELEAAHRDVAWERHAAVLTPGLVNAHTHVELSALRGRVPGGRGFVPWLRVLEVERGQLTREADADAMASAVAELVASGTAAVGEVTNTLAAVPHLAEAPFAVRVFHEVYALGREAARAVLEAARAAKAVVPAWPTNASYALAPHAPFSLHADALRAIAAAAMRDRERTSMHLAEHAAERAFLVTGDGPFAEFLKDRGDALAGWSAPALDPVRYAQALGALGPEVIAVHLSDARADEIAIVAAARAPVVVCPRSNLHIHLRLPPLGEMLAAGIRPGLGTDSLASAPSLDVMDDVRALHARFPSVAPRTLIAMATHWGAEALGLGARLGRLAPGLAPGVVAFAHDGSPPADPERWWVAARRHTREVLCPPRTALAQEAAP